MSISKSKELESFFNKSYLDMGSEEILNKPDNDGNPYQLDLNLPSVTGDKNDPKAMFMFAHNQSHPDCCPSTYSTSTGCVCVTKKQADHLSKRGGNQKNDLYPGI